MTCFSSLFSSLWSDRAIVYWEARLRIFLFIKSTCSVINIFCDPPFAFVKDPIVSGSIKLCRSCNMMPFVQILVASPPGRSRFQTESDYLQYWYQLVFDLRFYLNLFCDCISFLYKHHLFFLSFILFTCVRFVLLDLAVSLILCERDAMGSPTLIGGVAVFFINEVTYLLIHDIGVVHVYFQLVVMVFSFI